MPRASKVEPGQRWGCLTVIDRAGNYAKGILWTCKCDCGSVRVYRSGNLLTGASGSCGCVRKMTQDARRLLFNRRMVGL